MRMRIRTEGMLKVRFSRFSLTSLTAEHALMLVSQSLIDSGVLGSLAFRRPHTRLTLVVSLPPSHLPPPPFYHAPSLFLLGRVELVSLHIPPSFDTGDEDEVDTRTLLCRLIPCG